jgi:predicted TPR repeat methyltransferase
VGEVDVDYRLELHGRYSHGLAYVKRVLAESELTAEAESAELRNEASVSVRKKMVLDRLGEYRSV